MSWTATSSNSSATGRSPFLSASAMAPSYSLELPIAFSKIDGFDVTPLTPSLSISLFRSPLTMKPRARKSSQTDWPCCSSALTGFMSPVLFEPVDIGFQHLFWRDAEFCQQIHGRALTRSNMRIPGDNAIQNMSIPRGIGSLADISAQFCDFGRMWNRPTREHSGQMAKQRPGPRWLARIFPVALGYVQ